MKIESVANEKDGRSSGGFSDAMCSACEMAVSWMNDELKQNKTQEHVIDYVNKVHHFCYHLTHLLMIVFS